MEEKKIRFFFRVINYSYFWGAGWGTHRLVKIFINKTNQYICVGVWRGGGALFRSSCRLKVLFFLSFRFGKLEVQEEILYQWGGSWGDHIVDLVKKLYKGCYACMCVCLCVFVCVCVCVCVCLGWGVLSVGSLLGEAFCVEII